ncbi:glycosyltransferase [Rhodococcus sp. SORGH_AS_0303]|uniref:glycosyltransferase n=1 Tax=Rhodococcus sp. SORGH_AS_0303 TaxID=3041753 RepID=UPI002780199D|nr:glycosyltransferase [Rhodococcus sp. SORGH_AS_0303]MDQ1202930.1 glycosyltransferase involved in cell wall biosynthesis [Rhodococcus sp. SORGH_AS_0303]
MIDYLVGGVRISLDASSHTPGPRTHITKFVDAARTCGHQTDVHLASDMPLMGRFARVSDAGYKDLGTSRILAVDLLRVAIMVWCGFWVAVRSFRRPAPEIIYERSAVFQSLTSFHRYKKRAIRVVEANGIFSRETARDRNISRAVWLSALVERHVLRRADLVVVVSDALAREIEHFAGVDRTRMLVVPNGIDPALLEVERTKSDKFTFGFVGAVVEWQDLGSIIPAVCRRLGEPGVLVDGRAVAIDIVGDGSALDGLRDVVTRHSWGRYVTFHGQVPSERARSLMSTWDVGIAGHRATSSMSMYHSPLKSYEYAGMGLDILCTPSEDARRLAESGAAVHVFDSLDQLDTILSQPDLLVRDSRAVEKARRSVIDDHSWDSRVQEIVETARGVRV